MPVDETLYLKEQAQLPVKDTGIFFSHTPAMYNIDDMDDANFMRDHRMEGTFSITSRITVTPAYPGSVYVDGIYSASAIVFPNLFSAGSVIGLPVRRMIHEYGKTYRIRYEGAQDENGHTLPVYEFDLTTLPKILPGDVYPQHDELVLQAARESMVLLKNNNNTLPLGKEAIVNAFGKGCATFRLGCVGAGKINPRYGIRFEEGICNYSSLSLNHELFSFYQETESNQLPPIQILTNALSASDTAVIVLTRGTGESMDNSDRAGEYALTNDEKVLLETIGKLFTHTVLVLNTGYPIEMDWINCCHIDSVLWCGLPGMAGGRALAEILEGITCPSGRLPDTWAFHYNDYPSAPNFYILPNNVVSSPMSKNSYVNTVYEEDIYIGYRYFNSFGKKTAFPFGHGLSYTTFNKYIRNFSHENAHICFDVAVANTGNCFGKEAVLIFAQLPEKNLEQPLRRLVAFSKTDSLAPGASEVLHFDIQPWQLNSYDEKRALWIIEPGRIELFLGGSVDEAIPFANFTVTEEIITSRVRNRVVPPFPIKKLSRKDPCGTYPDGSLSGYLETDTLPFPRQRKNTPEKHPIPHAKSEQLITFPMLVKNKYLLDAFVSQLSDYELCRISVGGGTGWGADDNGFAGKLYTEGALKKYKLPEYYMADGNNGLNLHIATIGFPVSNNMCATFNESLSYSEGRALAKEARDLNLHCILAPAMNLHRNPLCGRHSEYFSEDPYLAGRMGGMESKGIESMGLSSVMKHFFANNAENFRSRNHSIMTERAARELYLRVFEVAMDVHMPDAVMTGYNPANGCWCAGDEELLEGILREEWGFKGYVMTDWGSADCCSPSHTVQAGNSWIAPGGMDDSEVLQIMEGIAEKTVDKERLKSNIRDMYRVIIKYKI